MAIVDLEDKDNWIQLCEVKDNELCFTQKYLQLTKSLGWGARKLAAHLITHWDKKFENVLDYFGPEDAENDWYSGIDGEGMDVGESLAEDLEYTDATKLELNKEWYRNIMRAKLATIKLPQFLIEEYVKAAQ